MARKSRKTKPGADQAEPRAADISNAAGVTASAWSDEVLADRIAERAYQRFLERGGEHGHDREDWLEAERECREEVARQTERAVSRDRRPADGEAAGLSDLRPQPSWPSQREGADVRH